MVEMEDTPKSIRDILTSDHHNYDTKLLAVKNLKKAYKLPDKIYSRLHLESLLQSAKISLENNKPDKNLIFSYGNAVVGFLGRDSNLDHQLFDQLEYILKELQKMDVTLRNALVSNLWYRLENCTVCHVPDEILMASTQAFEITVLNWVDMTDNHWLELFSKKSASSPRLFQTLTSILFEVLVRTLGHKRVLDVTESFLELVKSECRKEGKSFLGLYPKGCGKLVSFLMIPPEVLSSSEGEDVTSKVILLLLEMFLKDRRKVLMLLSHYSSWVGTFKAFLEQGGV